MRPRERDAASDLLRGMLAQRVEKDLLSRGNVVGKRGDVRRSVTERDALELAAQVVQRLRRQRSQRIDEP